MSKMQVGRKQYRSMRGKPVDMELLRKKNELTPAVGNARVNARGDEIGPGGEIVKKREQVIKEHYAMNPKTVVDGGGQFNSAKTIVVPKEDLTEEEAALLEEDDEWVEDTSGNFVKKGD
jgi:hypothetical protein